MQQLSLSARPKTLDGLIGQERLVTRIRGHMTSGRMVNAWLLFGPRGGGKTTAARILASAFQCPHEVKFGTCKECYDNRSNFDISEVNAAKITGKDAIEAELQGADFAPRSGKYRVYILDEVHKASDSAQNLMLKYLEDSPPTTVFILCSTDPNKLIETLQSRCTATYKVKALGQEDILKLVEILLKKAKSNKPADRLADQLFERGVNLPRLIANAVERYVSGNTPDESAEVEAGSSVDVTSLTRAIIKGEWNEVRAYLYHAELSDAKAIRLGILAYLRGIILNDSGENLKNIEALANAMDFLIKVQYAEDIVTASSLASVLWRVTGIFAQYKR